MRNALVFLLGTCLISLSAGAWAVARQSSPSPVTPEIVDEMLQAVRADLQTDRADIIAKNVTLTSAQAAKFWPLYESYQSQQNVIMDDQLKGLQRYIDGFDSLERRRVRLAADPEDAAIPFDDGGNNLYC